MLYYFNFRTGFILNEHSIHIYEQQIAVSQF